MNHVLLSEIYQEEIIVAMTAQEAAAVLQLLRSASVSVDPATDEVRISLVEFLSHQI